GIARFDEGVEVPAHTGRRDAQPLPDPARGDRTLQQQPEDGPASVSVGDRSHTIGRRRHRGTGRDGLRTEFHNTIVTEFRNRFHPGHPKSALGPVAHGDADRAGHITPTVTLLEWRVWPG